MHHTTPLIDLTGDSQAAITLITECLTSAGLKVIRSFDLQVARASHVHCNCPNHGTDQCSCHMVVLLVYEHDRKPITLVEHGHDGVTHLVYVDHPDQRPDTVLLAAIRRALSLTNPPDANLRLNSYAG